MTAAQAKNRTKENPGKAPIRRTFPGRFHLSLEKQIQSKLNLSRIIGSITCGSNFSKVGTGEVAGIADRDDAIATKIRSIEVRVVKDVEEFGSELQREPFRQREGLEQGEV